MLVLKRWIRLHEGMQKARHGGDVGLRIYNIFLQVFETFVYFSACAHRRSSSISYYYDHYFSLCCLYISHSSCTKDEQFHDYPNGIHPILCYSKKAMKKKCFVILCEMEGVAIAHVAWQKLTIALCLSWTLKTITLFSRKLKYWRIQCYMILGRNFNWRRDNMSHCSSW